MTTVPERSNAGAAPRQGGQPFGFPDISFPHGTSSPYIAFAAPMNWLFDRIPGFNKLQADPESIQRRFGIFGESMILGFILGLATIPFIVAMMVPIFRGNIVRSVIGGAIVIGLGLFIASATAASFTAIAISSGFELPPGSTRISSLVDGANPLTGLFFLASGFGGWTIAVPALAAVGFAYGSAGWRRSGTWPGRHSRCPNRNERGA